MILFIMQRMHHAPFYNAKDAPWSFLHCNGCNMLLFILLWMHHDHLFIAINAQCYFNTGIAMDAPCYFLYCNGRTMITFILQWMHNVTFILQWSTMFLFILNCIHFVHHVPFYIAMDAPCSFLCCNLCTIFFLLQ